jgi:hypothetical protein
MNRVLFLRCLVLVGLLALGSSGYYIFTGHAWWGDFSEPIPVNYFRTLLTLVAHIVGLGVGVYGVIELEEELADSRESARWTKIIGTPGVHLVALERFQQIHVHGFNAVHDDEHKNGELAAAAASYLLGDPTRWPFEYAWWKPKSRAKDLIRAAAFIIAEIDRLDRLHPIATTEGKPCEGTNEQKPSMPDISTL